MKWLLNLADLLAPPNNATGLKRWRGMVFISLLALAATLTTHLLAAKGAFESIGIAGVARADEVAQNGVVARAILRTLTAEKLRQKVADRCNAETRAEREKINQDIDTILRQFRIDTGQEYGDLPTCDQV